MKIIHDSLCNENGSVLLLSVVMLILLTLLGMFATTTSTIEIQISGNDKIHKQRFYDADSGVSSALSMLTFDDELTDDNKVGQEITTDLNNFEITLLKNDVTPCPGGSKCIEIEVVSPDPDEAPINAGKASIIAAIELQSSDDTAPPGNDTTN